PGSEPANDLRLIQPDHRFGERVVVRIPTAADRRRNARVGEAIGVAHREILRAAVAIMDQPVRCVAAPVIDRLLQGIEEKSVTRDEETRQPTIRRAKTSMTNAT